jgi:hypothetical protein
LSDIPPAKVVQDGALSGDVPRRVVNHPASTHPPYTRKLSNLLLDRKLQLRYVLVVTVLSALIAGSLGYLIYHQRHSASESIGRDLAALTSDDSSLADLREQNARDLAADDRMLVYKMAGGGIALMLILTGYLVFMTHKVAGPLFKTATYFDRMARGKLGDVSALRSGDMLQDFFGNFREMHDGVRKRFQADLVTMEAALVALRARVKDPAAIDAAERHITQRKRYLL